METYKEATWAFMWSRIDSIEGWLTEGEAHALYMLAREHSGYSVELGAFMGRSTAALAYGKMASNFDTDRLVVSIDTWQGTEGLDAEESRARKTSLWEAHRENMRQLGLEGWSRRIRGRTVPDGAEWAREWYVRPGLVFVDADHSYPAVKADVDGWAPLVRPGGVLAFHDSWAPGPSRVISELPQAAWSKTIHVDSLTAFVKVPQ